MSDANGDNVERHPKEDYKDKKNPPKTLEASEVGKENSLSNKELKELKKKEKAAKRAAQKSSNGVPSESSKQQPSHKKQIPATSTNLKKQLNQTLIKDANSRKKIPSLFSHLETREQRNASSPSISHIVHPAILSLALRYSTYKTVGSAARLRQMLQSFKVVIRDYHTPPNTTLTRHLTGHLSHQIEYLKSARPLSISMGNAIRMLKQDISHISIDSTEEEAKKLLIRKIDDYIKEKIDLSEKLIVENASQHISHGSTILTFGYSQVLEELFKFCAVHQRKKFSLIIVDSRPLFEGKTLLRNLIDTTSRADDENNDNIDLPEPLTQENIKIQYALINSLSPTILQEVDCVFLGAHAMLSNGRLFSRVGTGLIAMMCHTRNIPVLVCCDSIKFSDRVQLDSLSTNELSDSEDLVLGLESKCPPAKKSFALEQFIKNCEEERETQLTSQKSRNQGGKQKNDSINVSDDEGSSPLKDWKNIDNLSILNIMYDLTPPDYINKVVTEYGALPPSSVPVILREYKSS